MSYAYVDGDGVSALDPTTPNGATEPGSALDDAIRQIKAYLADSEAGPQALIERLSSNVRVVATMASAQSFVLGSAAAKLEFDTEDLDASSNFNPTLFNFTAPDAGLYMVVAQANFTKTASAAPTGIQHTLAVYLDGIEAARVRLSRGTDEADFTLAISRIFNLSAGQTLDVRYVGTLASGTMTVDTIASPLDTIFQVTRFAV